MVIKAKNAVSYLIDDKGVKQEIEIASFSFEIKETVKKTDKKSIGLPKKIKLKFKAVNNA